MHLCSEIICDYQLHGSASLFSHMRNALVSLAKAHEVLVIGEMLDSINVENKATKQYSRARQSVVHNSREKL